MVNQKKPKPHSMKGLRLISVTCLKRQPKNLKEATVFEPQITTEGARTMAGPLRAKAAEGSGYHRVLNNLCDLYYNAYYLEKNLTKAYSYFANAAKKGNLDAMYMLGRLRLELKIDSKSR